jgi:hypothetical protein
MSIQPPFGIFGGGDGDDSAGEDDEDSAPPPPLLCVTALSEFGRAAPLVVVVIRSLIRCSRLSLSCPPSFHSQYHAIFVITLALRHFLRKLGVVKSSGIGQLSYHSLIGMSLVGCHDAQEVIVHDIYQYENDIGYVQAYHNMLIGRSTPGSLQHGEQHGKERVRQASRNNQCKAD